MKRVLRVLVIGGLAVFAGCDNFLTPKPATFSSSDQFFQTPAHMERAVTGAYSDMRLLYGNDWRDLIDLRADLITRTFNINIPTVGTLSLDEMTEFLDNNVVAAQYGRIFTTIYASNQVIDRIENVTFTDQAQKARIIGEAKFIRALAYWQAVQLFGLGEGYQPNNLAVPLILKEVTGPEEAFTAERATVKQVLDQIVKDLSEAKAALPVRGSAGATGGNAGRITRGAATFLLGSTYQLSQQHDLALAQFEALQADGYALITSPSGSNNAYRQVFNPANKNNIESVLEMQYNVAVEDATQRQELSTNMAPLNSLGGGNPGSAQRAAVFGPAGGGNHMPTSNYVLSFTGADPSKPATPVDARYTGGFGAFCPGSGISGALGVADVIRPGTDPALSSPNSSYPEVNVAALRDPQTGEARTNCIPYFIKWRWPEQMPVIGRDNNNWIVFRYADALLRRAESLARLNRPTEALGFVNQVRQRAGVPALTGLSGQALLDAILQERALELGGEAHRWLDLKRFSKATEIMVAHGNDRRARVSRLTPDMYRLDTSPYRLRYPIRQRDVELSQCRILQNPGWGQCPGA
jgi:hypothetical protein